MIDGLKWIRTTAATQDVTRELKKERNRYVSLSPILLWDLSSVCWSNQLSLAHELQGAGDAVEYLIVGAELVIGRHADHIEERSIVHQRRVERNPFGAASHFVLIR